MTSPDDRDHFEELRAANPVPREELREGVSDADRKSVRDRVTVLAAESDSTRRRNRRRLLGGIGLSLAGAAAAVAIFSFDGDSVQAGPQRAYAAAVVAASEESPRVLVGAEGWEVTRADELAADSGEVQFSNGKDRVSVSWDPESEYPTYDPVPPEAEGQWFKTRFESGNGSSSYLRYSRREVLGREASVEEFLQIGADKGATTDLNITVAPSDGTYLFISAFNVKDVDAFMAALDSLYEADLDTWLEALPDSTVKPLERPQVVDELLRGIPLPDGFDVAELKEQPASSGREQLTVSVTRSVACAWLDSWAEARKAGDEAGADQAIDAMETSRDWPALRDLAASDGEGAWPQTIWEYADQMTNEPNFILGSGGTELGADGVTTYELRPAYAVGLTCESERRIPISVPEPPAGLPGQRKATDDEVAAAVAAAGGK